MVNIVKAEKNKVEVTEWGSLTWYASKELCASEAITAGQCRIKPGYSNSRHAHPNCYEILHVLEGTILHTFGDEEIRMEKGDTIVIPTNIPHNAANVGETEALLLITFSSGQRATIGE